MSKDDFKKRILEDSDLIKSHKNANSLNKFLIRNPTPLDNKSISKLLLISEKEVEEIYQKSVDFLKKSMVESDNED